MRALVLVPTYNERENILQLLAEVLQVDQAVHILVIDDGSPDGTGDLVETVAQQCDRVYVLHRSGKQGLGTAYLAGFSYALAHHYDCVVEMDADFSHRPVDLPRLLAAAEGADVVVGSRNVPGGRAEHWSPIRHLISRGGSLYARLVLGLPVRDCTSGFKCLRRTALEALVPAAPRSNGYAFQVEVNYLCAQAGLRFAEIPIVFPDRIRGRSKMSGSIVLEAAILVLRLRFGARHLPRPAVPAAETTMGGRGYAAIEIRGREVGDVSSSTRRA